MTWCDWRVGSVGTATARSRTCFGRPFYAGHVWSCDFVSTRTHDGRPLKLLTVLDEYTRECMAIEVRRSMKAHHVLEVLADPPALPDLERLWNRHLLVLSPA